MQAELRAELFEELQGEKTRLKEELIMKMDVHQRGVVANISINRVNAMR